MRKRVIKDENRVQGRICTIAFKEVKSNDTNQIIYSPAAADELWNEVRSRCMPLNCKLFYISNKNISRGVT